MLAPVVRWIGSILPLMILAIQHAERVALSMDSRPPPRHRPPPLIDCLGMVVSSAEGVPDDEGQRPGENDDSPVASSPGLVIHLGAMLATGLLTALGALLSIVPFEAMRNLAAIWLGESSPQGWRGSPRARASARCVIPRPAR